MTWPENIVIMRRGENPLVVCRRIEKMADEINAHYLPPGVKLVMYYDRTALMDRTLHTVRKNMLEGIALVLTVLCPVSGPGQLALRPGGGAGRARFAAGRLSCCWICAAFRPT